MPQTLLHFVHPALEKSRVNAHLLKRALTLEEVEVNDLYELYPDFQVEAKREQELMEAHDRVVFQFPLYWYSTPALLKEWFDIVLQYGWAYGKTGTALVGKRAKLVVSTGASAEAYTQEGHTGFEMEAFLRPILSTMSLCGMDVGKPLYIHGALHLTEADLDKLAQDYETWLLED